MTRSPQAGMISSFVRRKVSRAGRVSQADTGGEQYLEKIFQMSEAQFDTLTKMPEIHIKKMDQLLQYT